MRAIGRRGQHQKSKRECVCQRFRSQTQKTGSRQEDESSRTQQERHEQKTQFVVGPATAAESFVDRCSSHMDRGWVGELKTVREALRFFWGVCADLKSKVNRVNSPQIRAFLLSFRKIPCLQRYLY